MAASLDERLHQTTRDLFVGIAVLDHFSLTDATADTHGLVPRALEVAERSEVALHRVDVPARCGLGRWPGRTPIGRCSSCGGRSTRSPTCRR